MSRHSIGLPPDVLAYLRAHTTPEHPELERLRARTAELSQAGMQISPEQGALMGWLVRLLGVRRAVEVGTFTGYSALAVALSLPPDGQLVACDVSEEWTSIGEEAWARAGVAERVDLRIAPAVETLDALLADGQGESFDFAFIDADKENYGAYIDRCASLLRTGGVLLVDNVLWSGKVADDNVDDAATVAIRAVNDALVDHATLDAVMVPIGDGLTLARKR